MNLYELLKSREIQVIYLWPLQTSLSWAKGQIAQFEVLEKQVTVETVESGPRVLGKRC